MGRKWMNWEGREGKGRRGRGRVGAPFNVLPPGATDLVAPLVLLTQLLVIAGRMARYASC